MEKKNQKVDETLVIKLVQSHERLEKQLAEANAKLAAVKNALPNMRALSGWGSGPRAFVEKIQNIIDAPEVSKCHR